MKCSEWDVPGDMMECHDGVTAEAATAAAAAAEAAAAAAAAAAVLPGSKDEEAYYDK